MRLQGRRCNYTKLGPAPTGLNSSTSCNSTQQTGKREHPTALTMNIAPRFDLHMEFDLFQVRLTLTLSADIQTLNLSYRRAV